MKEYGNKTQKIFFGCEIFSSFSHFFHQPVNMFSYLISFYELEFPWDGAIRKYHIVRYKILFSATISKSGFVNTEMSINLYIEVPETLRRNHRSVFVSFKNFYPSFQLSSNSNLKGIIEYDNNRIPTDSQDPQLFPRYRSAKFYRFRNSILANTHKYVGLKKTANNSTRTVTTKRGITTSITR